ncbi:monovalent cation/H(+) antiporter subunit G [Salinirubrum litoreum]|uniref:Monovalent cation/H(+) antiporter subunit G n=1 Tax=Salinirubrum litoreum TaxID=1126234 RepID=A0ABD5REK4_9EURY|nr:monovalent cation/H(+) antiporter subunit G [Salinirubrum litoreum]
MAVPLLSAGLTVDPAGPLQVAGLSAEAVLVALLVAGSAFFSLVAVVGFYRLPDVYSRAHAASKSETLGALLAFSAAGVVFGLGQASLKLALLALFVLVTGPTAAHAVVRSAADAGRTPWTRETGITDGGASTDDAGVAETPTDTGEADR